jgi:hypothetical protein
MRGLAGDGLFAARAIKKDELVCMWGGTIYTGEQFEEQPEAMKHYGLQVGENLYIAPANLDSVDDAEYFNHSCEPNCGFRGQAALVAMRDIRAGEELTFDYAMAETYDHPWKCECGSKHCRGTLRGTDHNLPELRDRYRGYFSEWLEKKHADQLDDADYLHRFRATGAWGLDTGLDLHECNPEIIRSAEKIVEPAATWNTILFYKPKPNDESPDGFKGRIGIHEVLPVSQAIKELILRNASPDEIEAQAKSEGMMTMLEDGIFQAVQGKTTIEEVLRVVSE